MPHLAEITLVGSKYSVGEANENKFLFLECLERYMYTPMYDCYTIREDSSNSPSFPHSNYLRTARMYNIY